MEDNTNKTEDIKYNGYKNRATWNAALWFNNDRFLYHQAIKVKTVKDLKILFNSEMDLFKDFWHNGNFNNKMAS